MAGLTVGGTDFECEAFSEGVPRYRGEIMTAFDNTLRSSISSEKRQIQATTSPVSKTKYEAMQSALANGASVTVTGDLLLGDSLTMKGTVTYALVGLGSADAGYNHNYRLQFNLAEA